MKKLVQLDLRALALAEVPAFAGDYLVGRSTDRLASFCAAALWSGYIYGEDW